VCCFNYDARCQALHSADYVVAWCLSVRLSRWGIVAKWLNMSSSHIHRLATGRGLSHFPKFRHNLLSFIYSGFELRLRGSKKPMMTDIDPLLVSLSTICKTPLKRTSLEVLYLFSHPVISEPLALLSNDSSHTDCTNSAYHLCKELLTICALFC